MLQRQQSSETGDGSVGSSTSNGVQSDTHVILQSRHVGGEEQKADQLELLDPSNLFVRDGELQENSIRFPTLDIGEDELYFRDTENRFTFGQCEPMTGSLIGCMPSMPQTMMKPHLFATDFFERVAFEVMLDNLKHYKRMNTGLQYLGVSSMQIDATLQDFTESFLVIVLGRDHYYILQKLWALIRIGTGSDLTASKEFAICVAECVVWVFAHVHNRWCVKDPNSFQSTTEVPLFGGPRYVFAIRHFGDTSVENNSWREPAQAYLNRNFLETGGCKAVLLQRLSMCEMVYFTLLCVKLVHSDILFTHTLDSWSTEARNISQRNIGRSFGIIFGARGFSKGNVDRNLITRVYREYSESIASKSADRSHKTKRRKTDVVQNHLKYVGIRYISSTPTLAHFTPRFTNKNKKGRDEEDATRRNEIPKLLSHFFFHPLWRPIRDSEDADWFRVQVQWLLPQEISKAITLAHLPKSDQPDNSAIKYLNHPNTQVDIRAIRSSYLYIHSNLWRPVPPSELCHFQAPYFDYQESLLQEYRLRWFDPHQWLWVIHGQRDQLDLTRLEWNQVEPQVIGPQLQTVAEAYYTSFVGDINAAGARWAAHPENLRRFYNSVWSKIPGGTAYALYQTLVTIETQYLEEITTMFKILHANTRIGQPLYSMIQDKLSLSAAVECDQLINAARICLTTPDTFECMWAATELTPINSHMLPENWKTIARSVIMTPDAPLADLGDPQQLSLHTWNDPSRDREIITSGNLPAWWQVEMNVSLKVAGLFIRDILCDSTCIDIGPDRKTWLQFAQETTTQHASHTIVAHVMQQLEQFIDQIDIISKLELSMRLGKHTRVSPDLLNRMAHLIQIVPESKLKDSAYSRLANVIELCIDNSGSDAVEDVKFVPLMEAQAFSDAEDDDDASERGVSISDE